MTKKIIFYSWMFGTGEKELAELAGITEHEVWNIALQGVKENWWAYSHSDQNTSQRVGRLKRWWQRLWAGTKSIMGHGSGALHCDELMETLKTDE